MKARASAIGLTKNGTEADRTRTALIEKLSLEGYFLIVWDIVQFCRRNNILVQGRGSAANSAVCYVLGITAVDPVGMELLFERFLSEERGEWPDIDLDLPSGDQRERAIQYVYQRYGPRGAAMTANVITYRGRSAAREVGKVLGFDAASLGPSGEACRTLGIQGCHPTRCRHSLPAAGSICGIREFENFSSLCLGLQDLPRHLGQHSGGMVVCQGQLDSVVPLEPATMPGRTVVQWDKDDCADMGIIKVDLLGLGMMAVLEDSIQLIRDHQQKKSISRICLPDDPATYAAIQKADTVGMFQIESRAQMSCLPRMRPDHFYDLVVQVAIIRPGPDRRKDGASLFEAAAGTRRVTYPHPSLEPVLERTLGVPLFQEQLLRMAMIAAGFSGGEAEELRRAFGFKRSERRMKEIETKLRAGMTANGIVGSDAGRNHSVDHVIRALWISRIACGQLRADRVCERVSEVSLPRRVHRRHAEQSADGVLQPGHAGERCATAWIEDAADRCDALGLGVHAGGGFGDVRISSSNCALGQRHRSPLATPCASAFATSAACAKPRGVRSSARATRALSLPSTTLPVAFPNFRRTNSCSWRKSAR